MRRSAFLQLAAGAMTAACIPPLSKRALAADTLDYTLTAAPLLFAPAPGVSFDGSAFNGTIPGPVLRIVHGQRLRARFVNDSG